ncbi:transposase family protein [Burkholderia pseudomallei MSHR543]|nr:transposase family protein [Burkholderia pseudomallei MSHR543]
MRLPYRRACIEHSNPVLIELSDGKRQRFRMTNSAPDFDRLLSYLQALPGNCRVALEPTGDYHRPLAHRLLTAGHEVVSIHSVAQARYREAMFNSWDKNDPKDAQVILEMLRRGTYQRYVDPQIAGHHDLQELAKTYYQVSRARTKVQHSLINHSLPLYFPEMHRYWCTTRNEWFLRFLLEFPTPTHVRALDRESFVAAAWDLVDRKMNKRAKLEEIWETAAHTAALPHAPNCLAVETFRITLRRYQELNVLRAAIEARAEAELHDNNIAGRSRPSRCGHARPSVANDSPFGMLNLPLTNFRTSTAAAPAIRPSGSHWNKTIRKARVRRLLDPS